jgi:hypothetical protein
MQLPAGALKIKTPRPRAAVLAVNAPRALEGVAVEDGLYQPVKKTVAVLDTLSSLIFGLDDAPAASRCGQTVSVVFYPHDGLPRELYQLI